MLIFATIVGQSQAANNVDISEQMFNSITTCALKNLNDRQDGVGIRVAEKKVPEHRAVMSATSLKAKTGMGCFLTNSLSPTRGKHRAVTDYSSCTERLTLHLYASPSRTCHDYE